MAPKALIIDDDEIASDLVTFLLSKRGFTLEAVQDGSLALDAARKFKPDIILLDIMMPGLDGITICTQLKKDPQFKDTKVVIISARSFSGEKARAVEAGADLFIAKPYKIDSFTGIIESLLGEKKPKPEAGARGS